MSTLLIEPVYAGPVSFYKAILSVENVVFDIHSHFEKRSYRNRCEILGANGILRLSIPLEKGKDQQKQILKDIRISYAENWQKDHWTSLVSAYRRAPFFEYYESVFHPFYEKKMEFLTDFNVKYFEAINAVLKRKIDYSFSEAFIQPGEFTGKDLRNKFSSQKKEKTAPYLQVFADRHAFAPDLSLLDVLFNLGTRSGAYLDKSDLQF